MESLWIETKPIEYQTKTLDFTHAEVVVIGAGMTGVLTAYELKKRGMDVKVIDAGKIAGGVTKNTTAKITAQHHLIYDRLLSTFGVEKARLYYEANTQAIQEYESIIKEKNISCGYTKAPSYVYAIENQEDIEKELKACEQLNIHADYTDHVSLPFEIASAIRFSEQASFHPLAFLNALVPSLDIYEDVRITGIEENEISIGRRIITADHIVLASHYPFVNVPGYYFMRMHQDRSYVLALKDAGMLDGMYISCDSNSYSFRNYDDYLLFGGEGHRTGKTEAGGRYDKLRKKAKEYYPEAKEVYYWSAQDCMSIDGIPYIGRFADSTPHMYVATGFNKWGMTSAMAASHIISDLIMEKENDYTEVFGPSRFNMTASMKGIAINSLEAIKGLVIKNLTVETGSLEQLECGRSDILQYEGEEIGAYKDKNGELFLVSVKCTHLGCRLEWNQDELTWDCPCHGSRFDYKGNVINSPALKELHHV